MTEQTLVAVYDTAAHADAVVMDLKAASVPASAISQHAKNGGTSATTTDTSGEKPSFWSKLIGTAPEHDTTAYNRSLESGATVVTVKVPEEHVERVSEMLEKHNPVDLNERAASYGSAETTTTQTTTTAATTGVQAPVMSPKTAADGGTIELAEETLSVGKRAVSGGTTRIRRYVVETPVEEQVSLHSEKVTLERRPVTDGHTVGAADFTDRTIEMTETSEEAVVAKTARVTEEISLHKEVSDRVETVKDTVRRDEVEIENVPGGQSTTRETTTGIPATPAQRTGKV